MAPGCNWWYLDKLILLPPTNIAHLTIYTWNKEGGGRDRDSGNKNFPSNTSNNVWNIYTTMHGFGKLLNHLQIIQTIRYFFQSFLIVIRPPWNLCIAQIMSKQHCQLRSACLFKCFVWGCLVQYHRILCVNSMFWYSKCLNVCIVGSLVRYNWLVLYSNWIPAYANTSGRWRVSKHRDPDESHCKLQNKTFSE